MLFSPLGYATQEQQQQRTRFPVSLRCILPFLRAISPPVHSSSSTFTELLRRGGGPTSYTSASSGVGEEGETCSRLYRAFRALLAASYCLQHGSLELLSTQFGLIVRFAAGLPNAQVSAEARFSPPLSFALTIRHGRWFVFNKLFQKVNGLFSGCK